MTFSYSSNGNYLSDQQKKGIYQIILGRFTLFGKFTGPDSENKSIFLQKR